jgi:putative peptidoglycan lipid II flippase
MRWLGVAGLVIAGTAAIIVQTILLQRSLVRRLPGMSFRPLWPSLGKVAIGTAVMGTAVWLGWDYVQRLPVTPFAAGLIAIFAIIPLAVGLYAETLWLLRIEGREDFVALLRGKKSGAS